MLAMRFHEHGGPEVLILDEVSNPEPGPGQVRVRVAATSFNAVDGNIRAGFMTGPFPVELPHTPGSDVSGVVDAVGDGVSGHSVGDRVVGFLPMTEPGASAEYVLAPAEVLTAAPSSIPLVNAAALPLVGLTAYQALFTHAGLVSGQRILITGAGGAVGAYAVQLAKAAGAYVIATASSRSSELVRERGADEVLDLSVDVVEAISEPVDAVLNLAPLEPEAYAALTAVVRDGGVVVGTTVWMPAPTDEARGVRGVDVYVESRADQLADLVGRVDRGELVVDVAQRVAYEESVSVHRAASEGGLPAGKTVIVVEPELR
ncbi:NADP-dependent oxidoreductase [Nocardioidaceae bacterium]|nr:NADP-dependent oxidoreductase [Nocardioidaceae bacterium]